MRPASAPVRRPQTPCSFAAARWPRFHSMNGTTPTLRAAIPDECQSAVRGSLVVSRQFDHAIATGRTLISAIDGNARMQPKNAAVVSRIAKDPESGRKALQPSANSMPRCRNCAAHTKGGGSRPSARRNHSARCSTKNAPQNRRSNTETARPPRSKKTLIIEDAFIVGSFEEPSNFRPVMAATVCSGVGARRKSRSLFQNSCRLAMATIAHHRTRLRRTACRTTGGATDSRIRHQRSHLGGRAVAGPIARRPSDGPQSCLNAMVNHA